MEFSKITVIGGSGFVGTNFCQQLANEHIAFEIIDIQMSQRFTENCKIADVRDIESLRKTITGDVIVNLAAMHRDDVNDPQVYHYTNVNGAENICSVCKEKNIRKIIFTSSVAVYGFAEVEADENAAIHPFNDYGKSKYAAEEVFREWQIKDQNNLVIIRPTVIFGEGNRGNVFNLLNQIDSGKFVMIGNGRNKKSMAYIGNVVAFLMHCLYEKKNYAVYNYADSPDMDMLTLIKQVRNTLNKSKRIEPYVPYWLGLIFGYLADGFSKVTGKKLLISSVRVRKFCANTCFKSSSVHSDSFKAPFSLKEGLTRTLHSEFIEPDPNREAFYTE